MEDQNVLAIISNKLDEARHALARASERRQWPIGLVKSPQDGYANLDMALAKRFKVREGQSLRFRWEVFNVPNMVRFNVLAGGGLTPPSLQRVVITAGRPCEITVRVGLLL